MYVCAVNQHGAIAILLKKKSECYAFLLTNFHNSRRAVKNRAGPSFLLLGEIKSYTHPLNHPGSHTDRRIFAPSEQFILNVSACINFVQKANQPQAFAMLPLSRSLTRLSFIIIGKILMLFGTARESAFPLIPFLPSAPKIIFNPRTVFSLAGSKLGASAPAK